MVQKEQGERGADSADVRREGIDRGKELEQARERAAEEMEKRCERVRERMVSGRYPMQADNPLLNATDEQIRAYIRKRREEFQPKLEEYERERAKRIAESKKLS